MLFRELGYDHPLTDLIKYIIVPVRTKDSNDFYTKFKADKILELLDYLEGGEEEYE